MYGTWARLMTRRLGACLTTRSSSSVRSSGLFCRSCPPRTATMTDSPSLRAAAIMSLLVFKSVIRHSSAINRAALFLLDQCEQHSAIGLRFEFRVVDELAEAHQSESAGGHG